MAPVCNQLLCSNLELATLAVPMYFVPKRQNMLSDLNIPQTHLGQVPFELNKFAEVTPPQSLHHQQTWPPK
jgi:hypothetical protein